MPKKSPWETVHAIVSKALTKPHVTFSDWEKIAKDFDRASGIAFAAADNLWDASDEAKAVEKDDLDAIPL